VLLLQSVQFCNVLGVLFSTLKEQERSTGHSKQFICQLEFDQSSGKNFAKLQLQAMYAGLLLPFQGHKYTKKKKEITAIEHILTESLKQSNDTIKNVVHFIKDLSAFDDIMKIHRDVKEKEGKIVSPEDTLTIAHALRSIGPQLNAICLLHVAKTYTLSVPHK